MAKLIPLQLDDNTIIYIEASEDTNLPLISTTASENEDEEVITGKGISSQELRQQVVQNFHLVQNTIRAYALYALNAFHQFPIAKINKVTLEFGIEMGGQAGVPFVTQGTAKSNLKITVECSFPQEE